MSEENEKIKPKTDFELFLNYADQCVWKNLKNDSGAGANAASSVDMTFAATDPLSEIVWSPDKGLSLKCADSSVVDKNNSFFRDVGPSSMKPIDDVFLKPMPFICAKSDIAATDTPIVHPTSDSGIMLECKAYEENDTGADGNQEKIDTADQAPNLPSEENENLVNDWEKNTCDQANNGTDKIPGIEGNKVSAISGQFDQMPFNSLLLQSDEPKPSMERNASPSKCSYGGIDIVSGKKIAVLNDALYDAVEPVIEYKASDAPGTNLASSSRGPLQKLESTAENDFRTLSGIAACPATRGVLVREMKRKSQDNETMLLRDNTLPVLDSCISRIHTTMNKGKEKSLSDGDANVRLSLEDNDSHSSVESCNSGGFFSRGKKRCNFQQQLIIGNKRVKRQIQETPGSEAYVKQDSSFMNWISNMVKGLSQSVQGNSTTLAFTLANPGHQNLRPGEKRITCNTNQDSEPKSTGFKSIFQSIYFPSLKNVTRVSHQEGEGSEDLEPGNMVHGIDATPITCCAENNSLYRQYLQTNKSGISSGRYDAGPSSRPMVKPLNYFSSHESSKNVPVENKNFSMLGLSKGKEEMASLSSSTRQNSNNVENIDSSALCERKEADNISHRGNTLGSLWITRFSSKSTAPLNISDHLNERGGSQVQSTDCSKLSNSNKHMSYLNNCKIEETREQSSDDTEACTGLKEDKGNNDHISKHKFIPLSSSPGFRTSEPMSSMFARRLGAIRRIIPTNTIDSTMQVNLFCLFCGTRGHQLSDCSDIAESDVEDLQKNINSGGGLEEPPCLCIKCFQHNHWAVSCPNSMSKRKHELEDNGFVNDSIPTGKHVSPSNEGSVRFLTGEDDRIFSSCLINDGTDHQAERNLNLKRKSNELVSSELECGTSFKKYCSSSSEENKFKENPMISVPGLAKRQISHVPKGVSDGVRNLRLSRTDILKWINAHGSISQLDGFFLRLRLGKWEEGLGGTGYHVASINEGHSQSSEQNTRKSLSVNVGGIKCMVESQYISNHDFLEEEIMEWWSTASTASEADAGIPSEEDLIEKIERKKLLGL